MKTSGFNINHLIPIISKNLEIHLDSITPNHPIKEIYQYSVFPTGKLFRPLLSCAIMSDLSGIAFEDYLKKSTSSLSRLCSSLELHHAYTLIHDDLPCMDNDEIRRGRPTVHKAFGEWKALLAGDGLLNGSYQLLSKINSPNTVQVLRFFSWATGPKGLILGQVYDLSEEMNQSFENLLRTHELKTARLMQTALVCGFLLLEDDQISKNKTNTKTNLNINNRYRTTLDLMKLGSLLGIVFQLLDDLSELAEKSISDHEKRINPWIAYHQKSLDELVRLTAQMKKISDRYILTTFNLVVCLFFQKIIRIIEINSKIIEGHLSNTNRSEGKDFNSNQIITLLKQFS